MVLISAVTLLLLLRLIYLEEQSSDALELLCSVPDRLDLFLSSTHICLRLVILSRCVQESQLITESEGEAAGTTVSLTVT